MILTEVLWWSTNRNQGRAAALPYQIKVKLPLRHPPFVFFVIFCKIPVPTFVYFASPPPRSTRSAIPNLAGYRHGQNGMASSPGTAPPG
jgi:hypothetical protein